MALIHEMKAASLGMSSAVSPTATFNQQQNQGTATEMFLNSMARQNLHALLKAVMRMELYWAGVTYVASLLEQRELFEYCAVADTGRIRRLYPDTATTRTEEDLHFSA
jgi:hypothetical protein